MSMSASVTDLTLPQASEEEKEECEPEAPSVGAYCSVDDVRMLRRVSIAALIQSLLLVVSVGVIALLVTRPAQQVVIERTTVGGSPSLRLEPGCGGERIGHEQAGFLETTQTQFATALNSLRRPFQSLIPTLQADHL
jgi:hypothetical protein